MDPKFFEQPILNSPYEYPSRHWELDASGQPTNKIRDERRKVAFITPIPKPKKSGAGQPKMVFDEAAKALETEAQQYDLTAFIGGVRQRVDRWRELPDPGSWQVTPETARLLQHWRSHRFGDIRPFFCQVEAVETAIWLTEVAPQRGMEERQVLDHLAQASEEANPCLARVALKLATGAGKTTVMAMIIAWQTINAVRRASSRRFTRGFLVVTPGVTIRDRLRVLQPNDPDSYYASRELVRNDMLRDLERAKIVVTNYHGFLRRETLPLSKGGRALPQGSGPELRTKETEGQMLQRVMPGLMGMKRILALNDEAHHCYREKPPDEGEEGTLKGEDRKEAERNRQAARVWISGLEAMQRRLGLQRVIDLSATPFLLRGSGYAEGTLFPWRTSDLSLMDAMPKFRNLWEHIRPKVSKLGRSKAGGLDPLSLRSSGRPRSMRCTDITRRPSSRGGRDRPLGASDGRLGVQMDPDGVPRLNRSLRSCLSTVGSATDFFHGLIDKAEATATCGRAARRAPPASSTRAFPAPCAARRTADRAASASCPDRRPRLPIPRATRRVARPASSVPPASSGLRGCRGRHRRPSSRSPRNNQWEAGRASSSGELQDLRAWGSVTLW